MAECGLCSVFFLIFQFPRLAAGHIVLVLVRIAPLRHQTKCFTMIGFYTRLLSIRINRTAFSRVSDVENIVILTSCWTRNISRISNDGNTK